MSCKVAVLTVLVCLFALTGFCQSAGGNSYFAPPAQLVAHRGGTALWPENTLLAFRKTSEKWPETILEMDVDRTSDGQLVLMHDDTVDRTTNGTGLVSSLTLAQIQALDAAYNFTTDGGSTFPYRGTGVHVPTLAEVLKATPGSRLWIEIKAAAGIAAVAPMVAAIREAGAEKRVCISSFVEAITQELRVLAPEILTSFTRETGADLIGALRAGGSTWQDYRPADDTLAIGAKQIAQYEITDDEVRAIVAKGIPFYVWTVDDPAEMRKLLQIPVSGIMTDHPDLLAEAIKAVSKLPSPKP